jgi:lysophospholipase L1-like esterase
MAYQRVTSSDSFNSGATSAVTIVNAIEAGLETLETNVTTAEQLNTANYLWEPVVYEPVPHKYISGTNVRAVSLNIIDMCGFVAPRDMTATGVGWSWASTGSVAITSISVPASNVQTVVTATHGLATGQTITITGATPGNNGTFVVTVTNTTTFTIVNAGGVSQTTGGTVLLTPKSARYILFAGSHFNAAVTSATATASTITYVFTGPVPLMPGNTLTVRNSVNTAFNVTNAVITASDNLTVTVASSQASGQTYTTAGSNSKGVAQAATASGWKIVPIAQTANDTTIGSVIGPNVRLFDSTNGYPTKVKLIAGQQYYVACQILDGTDLGNFYAFVHTTAGAIRPQVAGWSQSPAALISTQALQHGTITSSAGTYDGSANTTIVYTVPSQTSTNGSTYKAGDSITVFGNSSTNHNVTNVKVTALTTTSITVVVPGNFTTAGTGGYFSWVRDDNPLQTSIVTNPSINTGTANQFGSSNGVYSVVMLDQANSATRPSKLVAIGDSYFASFGSWVHEGLNRAGGTKMLVSNAGIGGQPTESFLQRIATDVDIWSPDYVLVGVGVNDCTLGYTAAQIQANVVSTVSNLVGKGYKVLYCNIPPTYNITTLGYSSVQQAMFTWFQSFNTNTGTTTAQARMVDIATPMSTGDGITYDRNKTENTGVHPNLTGQLAMAAALATAAALI